MCRLLLLVAMLAVPGFAVAADKPAGQPPNVILIFTDDKY